MCCFFNCSIRNLSGVVMRFFAVFALLLTLASPAHSMTVYCSNCSNEWVQAMDRVTNVQQLSTAIDQYSQAVTQTEQQIRMVQLNLQQYQNMTQNTQNLSPAQLSALQGEFRKLATLQSQLQLQRGDLGAMERAYQDLYPGYDAMSNQSNAQYQQRWRQWSNESDRAYQATFQTTGRQLQDLQNADDFDNRVQELLQTPQGRMEAIQAGNQLAAMQLRESREQRSVMNQYFQAQMQAASKAEQDAQARRAASEKAMNMSSIKGAGSVQGMDEPR